MLPFIVTVKSSAHDPKVFHLSAADATEAILTVTDVLANRPEWSEDDIARCSMYSRPESIV